MTTMMDDTATTIDRLERELAAERRAREEAEAAAESLAGRLRTATEDAEDARTRLETFLYGISHDLRTPLAVIEGFASLVGQLQSDDVDDRSSHAVERIIANARDMNEMIGGLVELSRMGSVTSTAEPVDLTAVLDHVSDCLHDSYPELTVTSEPLPTVLLTPTRARQLLSNLLENAAVHAGPAATVVLTPVDSITVPADGPAVAVVSIRDDGPGISDRHRDEIFEPFHRLGSDRPGTGMGLAICRRIAESAGGRLDLVDGRGGAEFHLVLPLAEVAG